MEFLTIDRNRVDQFTRRGERQGGMRRQLLRMKRSGRAFQNQPAFGSHHPQVLDPAGNAFVNAMLEFERLFCRFGECVHERHLNARRVPSECRTSGNILQLGRTHYPTMSCLPGPISVELASAPVHARFLARNACKIFAGTAGRSLRAQPIGNHLCAAGRGGGAAGNLPSKENLSIASIEIIFTIKSSPRQNDFYEDSSGINP
jgi:hypothetical protein